MAEDANATYIERGATANFKVAYLSSLGAVGISIADALLLNCETQYATLSGWFSGIVPAGLPYQVHITDGSTGASHPSCASPLISIGGQSAPANQLDFMRNLLFAEVAEVLMHTQKKGWDCGASNGEALSRVLAADLCLGSRPLPLGFVTAPTWLKNRAQNWVDNKEYTDQDPIANGCGVLFLNWLRFAQGHPWNQIIDAAADTLAKTYTNLTGSNQAWVTFRTVIDGMFPPNQPVTLTTDNPFKVHVDSIAVAPRVAVSLDAGAAPTSTQAAIDGFSSVIRELLANRRTEADEKPYLFPDGINDIEFECKFGATEGFDFKVKVSGGKV